MDSDGFDKKKMSFEEKMAKRQQEIEEGLVTAPVVSQQVDGGSFSLEGRLSKKEYHKTYNNYGTIGQPQNEPAFLTKMREEQTLFEIQD